MQLGDHPGVVITQGATAVDQQPQHGELLIVNDRSQSTHPGPDQRDRMRISGIGFAALTGGEHPDPRGQFRWHIDHLLTIGEQPVGDVFPDPVAALDRPRPLSGTAYRTSTSPDSRRHRWHTGRHQESSRHGPSPRSSPTVLCGSIPITTATLIASSSNLDTVIDVCELGGHRYFEQSKPFLSLSAPVGATSGSRRPNVSHTTSVGSRNENDEPDA